VPPSTPLVDHRILYNLEVYPPPVALRHRELRTGKEERGKPIHSDVSSLHSLIFGSFHSVLRRLYLSELTRPSSRGRLLSHYPLFLHTRDTR